MTYDVDVLVPAALEGQITVENAASVRARYILEPANGPTTPEADVLLEERGVIVLPDILANAGGVVVSYFEWEQNMNGDLWTAGEVDQRLGDIMRRAYHDVALRATELGLGLRLSAYCIALERLVAARVPYGTKKLIYS